MMANSIKPGEFVLQTLLNGFQNLALQKIENCMQEKSTNLSLSLKCDSPEDDQEFDHILQAWHTAAEYSLPSLITTLFDWHSYQHSRGSLFPLKNGELWSSDAGKVGTSGMGTLPSWLLTLSGEERNLVLQRRDLAVDYIFCVMLVRLLPQLSYHPGHEDLVCRLLDQAFLHFQYCADLSSSPNSRPINVVADKYAEVVGCLSQLRFALVKRKFVSQLKELRTKEQNTFIVQSIISLLIGMKFFRVQMHPIEAFVDCFTFLHELAQYFIEVKEKEIRHALAGLFVEILLPVAAVLKHEANIPALKHFVDLLYNPCLEMASKKKHILALFPLITCLLCVAQKVFFSQNWPYFMQMCLSQLKNRDTRLARVSLESLVRLLWVYIIRYKCEKPAETQARLTAITGSLFPKNSKFVNPKDAPNSLFIKVIHFISQERLNFAMTEVVFDLLSIGRTPIKVLVPERMNIGLCAFLVIAHSLQQREGEPPMPHHHLIYQHPQRAYHMNAARNPAAISGTMSRVKRCLAGETLTEATAHSLGIQPYMSQVRKAFDSILRLLDAQVVRNQQPWAETAGQVVASAVPNAADSVATSATGAATLNGTVSSSTTEGVDRDPKLELLRTCVCAIPRLLPSDMNKKDVINLLCRITLHPNVELRQSAHATLYHLMLEFPAWRSKVLRGFIAFFRQDIPDTAPAQMELCARILYNLICTWRVGVTKESSGSAIPLTTPRQTRDPLYECEGFCLVLLCYFFNPAMPSTSGTTSSSSVLPAPGMIASAHTVRRLAVLCLREVRTLSALLSQDVSSQQAPPQQHSVSMSSSSMSSFQLAQPQQQPTCMDVLDAAVDSLLPSVLGRVALSEQQYLTATHTAQPLDFLQVTDRCISHWVKGNNNNAATSTCSSPANCISRSVVPVPRVTGRLHANNLIVDRTSSCGGGIGSNSTSASYGGGLVDLQPTQSSTSSTPATVLSETTTVTTLAGGGLLMKERANTLPPPFVDRPQIASVPSLESSLQQHYDSHTSLPLASAFISSNRGSGALSHQHHASWTASTQSATSTGQTPRPNSTAPGMSHTVASLTTSSGSEATLPVFPTLAMADQEDDLTSGYMRPTGALPPGLYGAMLDSMNADCDLSDPWALCLAHIVNWRHLPLRCPTAVRFAHQYVLERLTTVFNLVDPSAQLSENRASVLIRNATKTRPPEKPEPSYLYPLFRNYAILCCAIAPSSTGVRLQLPHFVGRHLLSGGNWLTATLLTGGGVAEHPGLALSGADNKFGGSSSAAVTGSSAGAGTGVAATANVPGSGGSGPAATLGNIPTNTTLSGSGGAAALGGSGKSPHLKLLVPLLRCELADLREVVISALGRIVAPNFRDVLEDLHPLMKDSVDQRKQDSGKRRLRRDNLRCYLLHILDLMAQHDVFAFSESLPSITVKNLSEFLEAVGNMESTLPAGGSLSLSTGNAAAPNVMASAATAAHLSLQCGLTTRRHFCQFFVHLVRRLPRERRITFLSATFKQQIFHILCKWTTRYSFDSALALGNAAAFADGNGTLFGGLDMTGNSTGEYAHSLETSMIQLGGDKRGGGGVLVESFTGVDLEFLVCQAMVSLLCCGPLFNKSYLTDEPHRLVLWLGMLIKSPEPRTQLLGEEALMHLLEWNSDVGHPWPVLLQWTLDQCYEAKEARVRRVCFHSIIKIYQNNVEYPCNEVALTLLCLLFSSPTVSDTLMQNKALQLFQLIYHRFFVLPSRSMEMPSARQLLIENTWRSIPTHKAADLSRLLSIQHPDLTMPLFSEFCLRFEHSTAVLRSELCDCIEPWLYNIHLLDSWFVLDHQKPDLLEHTCSMCEKVVSTSGGNTSGAGILKLLKSGVPIEIDPQPSVQHGENTASTSASQRNSNRVSGVFQAGQTSSSGESLRPGLPGEGWWSREASELVLNNLYYLTLRYGVSVATPLERLWRALCRPRGHNLCAILHFLILVTSVVPHTLLTTSKRLLHFLATPEKASKIVEFLIAELQVIENCNFQLDYLDVPPFLRVILPPKSVPLHTAASTNDLVGKVVEKPASSTHLSALNVTAGRHRTISADHCESVALEEENCTEESRIINATESSPPPAVKSRMKEPEAGGISSAKRQTTHLDGSSALRHFFNSQQAKQQHSPKQGRSAMEELGVKKPPPGVLQPHRLRNASASPEKICDELDSILQSGTESSLLTGGGGPEVDKFGTLRAPRCASQPNPHALIPGQLLSQQHRLSQHYPPNNPTHNPTTLLQSPSETGVLFPTSEESILQLCLPPHPLPMPIHGTYWAPLNYWTSSSSTGMCLDPLTSNNPWPTHYRNSVLLMLLSDLLLLPEHPHHPRVDWHKHVPLLLHCSILGLDHGQPLVHEQCKLLLLNLLRGVLCPRVDLFRRAALLLQSSHVAPAGGTGATSTSSGLNNTLVDHSQGGFWLSTEGGPCRDRLVSSVHETGLSPAFSMSQLSLECCGCCDSSTSATSNDPVVPHSCELCSSLPGLLWSPGDCGSMNNGGGEDLGATVTFDPHLPMMPAHEDVHFVGLSSGTNQGLSGLTGVARIERVSSTTSVNSIATLIPGSAMAAAVASLHPPTSAPLDTPATARRATQAGHSLGLNASHLMLLRKKLHHSAQKLIQLLLSKRDQPLWVWEDISVSKFFQWKRQALLQQSDMSSSENGNGEMDHELTTDVADLSASRPRPLSCCSNVSLLGRAPWLEEEDSSEDSMWLKSESHLQSSRLLMYLVRLLSRLLRQYNELYHSNNHSTSNVGTSSNTGTKRRTVSSGSGPHHGLSGSTTMPSSSASPLWIQHMLNHRWPQLALNMGLRCTHRHHAARSLQIYRALQLTLTTRVQAEVLARLIETISDLAADVQSYVCELYLTLESGLLQVKKTLGDSRSGLRDARHRDVVVDPSSQSSRQQDSATGHHQHDTEILPGSMHFSRGGMPLMHPTHRFRPSVNFIRSPPLESLTEQQQVVLPTTSTREPLHVITSSSLDASFSSTDIPLASPSSPSSLGEKQHPVASSTGRKVAPAPPVLVAEGLSASSQDVRISTESPSPISQPPLPPKKHNQASEDRFSFTTPSPCPYSTLGSSSSESPSPEKEIPVGSRPSGRDTNSSTTPSPDQSPSQSTTELMFTRPALQPPPRRVKLFTAGNSLVPTRPHSSQGGSVTRPWSVVSSTAQTSAGDGGVDLRSHDSAEHKQKTSSLLVNASGTAPSLTVSVSASSLTNLVTAGGGGGGGRGNMDSALLPNSGHPPQQHLRNRTTSMPHDDISHNTTDSIQQQQQQGQQQQEEVEDVLCTLYWVALAFLQSDFEYEYQCGLSLLQLWFTVRSLEGIDTLEKLHQQAKRLWQHPSSANSIAAAPPMLLPLLLKGATHAPLYEPMCRLLSRILMLNCVVASPFLEPVVTGNTSSSASLTFPICVFTILPLLIEHFVSPTDKKDRSSTSVIANNNNNSNNATTSTTMPLHCILIAENIAWKADQLSLECGGQNAEDATTMGHNTSLPSASAASLKPLSAVMRLYSSQTFTKDVNQWIKCCVKYLVDAYAPQSAHLTTFLARLVHMGPPSLQPALAQFTNCFIQTLDFSRGDLEVPVKELIDAAFARFLHTPHWGEVLKSIRAVVSRSSILTTPPISADMEFSRQLPLVPLPEAECPRLELPGRTLLFQLDVCRFPLAGMGTPTTATGTLNNSESSLVTKSPFLPHLPAWLRPNCTQAVVRERMLQILNIYGASSPRRPSAILKSPSVIFSQSTETLDRPLGSVISSSDTTSMNDVSNPDEGKNFDDSSSLEQVQVLRNLDLYLDAQLPITFLDLDSDSWDDDDDRKPPWGVRKQSITHHRDFLEGGATALETDGGNEESTALMTDSNLFLGSIITTGKTSVENKSAPNTANTGLGVPGAEKQSADWLHNSHLLEEEDMLLKRRSVSMGHFYNSNEAARQSTASYTTLGEGSTAPGMPGGGYHARPSQVIKGPLRGSNGSKEVEMMLPQVHSSSERLPVEPDVGDEDEEMATSEDQSNAQSSSLMVLAHEEEKFFQDLQNLSELVGMTGNGSENAGSNMSGPLVASVSQLLPSALGVHLHHLGVAVQRLAAFLHELAPSATHRGSPEEEDLFAVYLNLLQLFQSLSYVLDSGLAQGLPFVYVRRVNDFLQLLPTSASSQNPLLTLQVCELFSELREKVHNVTETVEEITFAPSAMSRALTFNAEMIQQACSQLHKCYLHVQLFWERALQWYEAVVKCLQSNKAGAVTGTVASLRQVVHFCVKSVVPTVGVAEVWQMWSHADVDWHRNQAFREVLSRSFSTRASVTNASVTSSVLSPLGSSITSDAVSSSILTTGVTATGTVRSHRSTSVPVAYLPSSLLAHKLATSICQFYAASQTVDEPVVMFLHLLEPSAEWGPVLLTVQRNMFQEVAQRLCHIQRLLRQSSAAASVQHHFYSAQQQQQPMVDLFPQQPRSSTRERMALQRQFPGPATMPPTFSVPQTYPEQGNGAVRSLVLRRQRTSDA